MEYDERHPSLFIEAKDSWDLHTQGMTSSSSRLDEDEPRMLKHHHKKRHKKEEQKRHRHHDKVLIKEMKRKKELEDLYADSGIQDTTMHGMMIDAGSSGSRMHVFEFEPRVLRGRKETSAAVSGMKLSFPGTDSRWTNKLRPGIASFASFPDGELLPVRICHLT